MTVPGISFLSPWWLLALLILPFSFVSWHRYSRAPGVSRPHALIPYVRSLTLLLLILTLAGATRWTPVAGVDIHVLVDGSASVSAAAQIRARSVVERLGELLGPDDRMTLYTFGRSLVPLGVYQGGGFDVNLQGPPDGSATRIEHALAAVLQRLPENANSRVLILSDGIETEGDAMSLAPAAVQKRTPVDAFPLSAGHGSEALVEGVIVPEFVVAGEPYDVRAVVSSTAETLADASLYRNGELIARRPVQLHAGRNVIAFDGLREVSRGGDTVAYEVRINPQEDGFLQNNVGYGLVRMEVDARVLVVAEETEAGESFAELLARQGIAADVRASGAALLSPATLLDYRAIVLVDVPATSLSRAQMQNLTYFVEDTGGGLLAVGGSRSFGLGGYAHTELEELLPVSMDAPQNLIMPSVAMVLVLDRSGSMAETQGSFSKLDLAKEAALGVLDLMHDKDLIGVIAFDTVPYWVVPVQPVESRIAIASSIASLSAEGGTNLGPALDSAEKSLSEVEAALKHLIVLTDGRSTPSDFETLTRALRAAGVTVSTVGIGRDADRDLLAKIAEWGDGRFYYTEDIRAIPQIFATETTVITRPMRVDALFSPQWHQHADFWQETTPLPPLGGYVITTPKATAAVHLKAPDESPILATWRRGLGKTAAFTSGTDEAWLAQWREWEGYGAFMGQLVRWLMRADPTTGLVAQMSLEDDSGLLIVDALDADGGFRNFLELYAQVIVPDGSHSLLELEQVAPGRYQASFSASQQGVYTAFVTMSGEDEATTTATGAVRPYPDEYNVLRPDSTLLYRLAQQTGGIVVEDAAPETLAGLLRHPRPSYEPRPLAPLLLALSLFLVFGDIVLRYFPFVDAKKAVERMWQRRRDGRIPDDAEHLLEQVKADEAAWKAVEARSEPPASAKEASMHSVQQAGRYLARRKKESQAEKDDETPA